jgi:acetate kinase
MRILVVNAGSSTLKLRVIEPDDSHSESDDLPAVGEESGRLSDTLNRYGPIDAIGHRIVHGGTSFTEPVVIDREALVRLHELSDLAPLHQPKALAAVEEVSQVFPETPAVASFDTAFHSGLPTAAATYALPREWRERWGLRRYGFHGLSHSYAAGRAAQIMGRPLEGLRLVTCHLGAGASLAAVRDGRSVDTTMGFTPLEGLVMATRSGNVDPGLLVWLMKSAAMGADELSDGLENRSGLQGLAGTGDMREVLLAAESGAPGALLALDIYTHRLRGSVAAMTATLGGIDGLVFTGGVGENSSLIRQRVVDDLGFLGFALDRDRNQSGHGDREIGRLGESPFVLVVAAREDLQIAREVRQVLGSGQSAAAGLPSHSE